MMVYNCFFKCICLLILISITSTANCTEESNILLNIVPVLAITNNTPVNPSICNNSAVVGVWDFTFTTNVDNNGPINFKNDGTAEFNNDPEDSATWTILENVIIIVFNWVDDGQTPPVTGVVTLTGNLSNTCTSMSGTLIEEETGQPIKTDSFIATKN